MSYYCNQCGHLVPEGVGHACIGVQPVHYPPWGNYVYQPFQPPARPAPLTADEVRQIVREELERAKSGGR